MAKPAQQTVRFQTESEIKLLSMMAAAAGVSASEWIATAARERMLVWLRADWNYIDKDLASRFDEELAASVAAAPGLEDASATVGTSTRDRATTK